MRRRRGEQRGRKGGGEKAAVRPVSDYIIALQDLKQGLRRKKKQKTKKRLKAAASSPTTET